MTTYTVKSGDWISKIAQVVYGTFQPIGSWDPVKAIAEANPQIKNMNVISPGMVINIPDKPGAPSAETGTTEKPDEEKSSKAWLWLLAAVGVGGVIYGVKKHKDKAKAKSASLQGVKRTKKKKK